MNFGVWLSSCPRRSRKAAAELLTPHVGFVSAEWQVANAGGRCVSLHGTVEKAEELASALRAVGCRASAHEASPWP